MLFGGLTCFDAGALWAAPAKRPLERRLVRALGRRDPALLERAARRLGLAGMLRGLERDRPRAVRRAVIEAAPLVERAWLLLPALLQVMRDGRDRVLASQAAAATRAIAEGLRLPELDLNEEIPALMRVHGKTLARLASDQRVSLDVRVHSLLALAHLEGVAPAVEPQARLHFLSDPEPRIREAAAELFAAGAPRPVTERLARLVTEDRSMGVARAAAVVLCARVSSRGAQEYLALRSARAFPRIREMAESLDATDDQLVDIARCLARSTARADRRALAQLRRRSSRLRRLLRRLR